MTLREIQERNGKKWIISNHSITDILPLGNTDREFRIAKTTLFLQAENLFNWEQNENTATAKATLSEDKQEKSFTVNTDENWTARSLLINYAKRNHIPINYGKYGQIRLMIDGKLYGYKYVDNIYNNPITVYLQEV